MTRKICPDIISNQFPIILTPDRTGLDAARLMAARDAAAILITDNGKLVGMISERDLTRKIIARDLDPATTHLSQVMTPHPVSIAPDDTPAEALEAMRRVGCRHLPVLDGDRIVGLISIDDLDRSILAELDDDLDTGDKYPIDDVCLTV